MLDINEFKGCLQFYKQLVYNEAVLKHEVFNRLFAGGGDVASSDVDQNLVDVMGLVNLYRVEMLNTLCTFILNLYKRPRVLVSTVELHIIEGKLAYLSDYFERNLRVQGFNDNPYFETIYKETMDCLDVSVSVGRSYVSHRIEKVNSPS